VSRDEINERDAQMSDVVPESFARELAFDVDEAVRSEKESPYHEQEFTRIVLDRLSEEGALENPSALWQEGSFDGALYKISGYSIPDDEDRLALITTIYTGEVPPRRLSTDEILGACRQAIKFYECGRAGLHQKIEPSNSDVGDLARRIYEARKNIGVLRVVVISDQMTGLGSVDIKDVFESTRVVVDLYGIERLHRILGAGLTRDDIAVDIRRELGSPLPCIKALNGGGDYEAYLTAIPGSLLADIYDKYGTRLLELNVRAFLGLRGRKSVNAGLRETILQAPGRFLAYNNGIVATVDGIEIEPLGSGAIGIKSLRGLQIVNGGQTTASLHRASGQDGARLDSIAVPAKIIRVSGADLNEMVSAVSKSANSQNTVQPADFSANEPFHVAVESLANNVWLPDGSGRWFYERARGSYGAAQAAAAMRENVGGFASETPKERRFSKTDLAKHLNAWDGLPHLVSYGSQKNFQYFMQSLKDERADGFMPDENWYKSFVAKMIIFRAAQEIVKKKKFPAYQANITAYTVASIAVKLGGVLDLSTVWQSQSISSELRELIEKWAVSIDKELRRTAKERMPSEWAKKLDCWDTLQEVGLELPTQILPEIRQSPASASVPVFEDVESMEPAELDADRKDPLCSIRRAFNRARPLGREATIRHLGQYLGYLQLDDRAYQDLDGVIQTAIQRSILQNSADGLALVARNIAGYRRDVLKDQFLASIDGHGWVERSECIRRFARWMGFRRTGPNIEDTARSVINGLIRDDRIVSKGSQIRRVREEQ
jgi:hypothetical protein